MVMAMSDQERQEMREAWLMAMGWIHDSCYEGHWSKNGTGNHCLTTVHALQDQLWSDVDIAIAAMLRIPALLERIQVVRQLWNSPAWCDPEMSAAMTALFEEATNG